MARQKELAAAQVVVVDDAEEEERLVEVTAPKAEEARLAKN